MLIHTMYHFIKNFNINEHAIFIVKQLVIEDPSQQ